LTRAGSTLLGVMLAGVVATAHAQPTRPAGEVAALGEHHDVDVGPLGPQAVRERSAEDEREGSAVGPDPLDGALDGLDVVRPELEPFEGGADLGHAPIILPGRPRVNRFRGTSVGGR